MIFLFTSLIQSPTPQLVGANDECRHKADEEHHRVKEVTISKVDEKNRPIPGTEITFECDTLLLSVGLIPENELSKKAGVKLDPRTRGAFVKDNLETSVPGMSPI